MRVLVVDDEEAVRTAVRRALTLAGYEVEMAADGEEALASLAERAPDAIVLDILMPGVDGIEVCRRLRAAGDHTPVLMLTARDAVGDRVAGLDAGADDYMVKPFALQELLARLRALLRRTGNGGSDDAAVLRFDDLTLDLAGHMAERAGRPIDLTRTEFLLLELLMRNPASCSRDRSSMSGCGDTTSARHPTRWACTSDTSGERPRTATGRASSTQSAASATSCASHDSSHPPRRRGCGRRRSDGHRRIAVGILGHTRAPPR